MPTYEYECEKCHKHFEIFQSMKDQALTECPAPDCHGKVKRLLGTGAGLIFKGSGFYITDYRSQGYKEAAKQEKGEKTPKPAQKESQAKPEGPKASDSKPKASDK